MIDRLKARLAELDRWSQRHRTPRIARRAAMGFVENEAPQTAGSMAYFAVLSIFQVAVLGVVVLSFFLGEGNARQVVIDAVDQGSPLDQATIESIIDSAIEARGPIGAVSFILLLWSALAAFNAVNIGIGRAFKQAPPSSFLRQRLVGLFLMVVTGLLVIASVAIGAFTGIVQQQAGEVLDRVPGGALALSAIGLVLPFVLVFVAFLIIYRVVPNRPVSFGEVWPGALLAAVLWSILRIGFTYYATNIARYDTVFGPISTAISLLVFIYFASLILLVGAELARAIVVDDEASARSVPAAVESDASPSPAAPPARRRGLSRWLLLAGGAAAGVLLGRLTKRDDE